MFAHAGAAGFDLSQLPVGPSGGSWRHPHQPPTHAPARTAKPDRPGSRFPLWLKPGRRSRLRRRLGGRIGHNRPMTGRVRASRREIPGLAMFDFASQAYTLLIVEVMDFAAAAAGSLAVGILQGLSGLRVAIAEAAG